MTLTQAQRDSITESFTWLNKQQIGFATFFYDCLFDLSPLIKPLFMSDRQLIEKHFFTIFCTAVENINAFENLRPALLALGQRHAQYGVKHNQFATVKSALIIAIQHELKGRCTAFVEAAWSQYYDLLAAVIQEGMQLEPEDITSTA